MNAVVEHINPMSQLVPASEGAALIGMIERAARDPSVDIDKLRQLIELRKDAEERAAQRAFAGAMTAAQSDMRAIAPDSNNKQTNSRYASYHALDRALRPIYSRNGFSLSFNTADGAPENHVRVVCIVEHRDGHSRTYQVDMASDGKGAKGGDVMTKTHATGSALTYGSRYLLKMIFNVAVGEDDDDGNSAGGVIDQQQLEWLRSVIVEVGADIPKFCKFMGVQRLEDIPEAQYPKAITALNAKRSGSK